MTDEALELRVGEYWSEALRRMQSYAYFLPASAGIEPERRFGLYVLLHGLDGSFRDWSTHTRLARYASQYSLCIVLFDGGNGWYSNAADGSNRYEDALVHDFVPSLCSTLPLLPPGRYWAIGGASMGGYGAIKTALKHPDRFMVGVSHSGAFDEVRQSITHPVFGHPELDRACRREANVYSLAEDALSRYPTERPRLMIDCGLEDALLMSNRRFHEHLNFIGYAHDYVEMPGYHTWPYFDRALRTTLPVVAKLIGR